MPVLPYIDVNGSEIFNAERVVSYLRAGVGGYLSGTWELADASVPSCERLLSNSFGDPAGFTGSVQGDRDAGYGAYWYNADRPESTEFLGAIITSITGLSTTVGRQITDNPNGGGTLGNQRPEPRTITVKGLLVGSPCGIAYGVPWFNDYLRASCPCGGPYTFGFYKACAGDPDRWPSPTFDGYWIVREAALGRAMKIRPVDPRNVTAAALSQAGCDLAEFEFEIVAANPYLYKPLRDIVADGSAFESLSIGYDFEEQPPMGILAPVITWISVSGGKVTVEGDTVIEFAGLDPDAHSIVIYDASLHTFVVGDENEPSRFLDGAAYITSLAPGDTLEWIENGPCVFRGGHIVVEATGSSTVIASLRLAYREL